VIDTSASAFTVVPCVALLLAATGSLVLELTLAEFERLPAAVGVTAIATVAEPPLAIVPSGHVTTPVATEHVPCDGVAEPNVTPAGSGSLTETPWASDGPAFVTVSVYVSVAPTEIGSTSSVFVIARSALVATVVPCVAESFALFVSVVLVETVAVFDNAAVREALTCTVSVRTTFAPEASVPMFHVTVPPDGEPPFDAETKLVPAGSGSEIWTFCAVDGPAFDAVRVYVRSVPAVTGSTESVFVSETSTRGLTVVPCVAELFPGVGSEVDDVTVAVFESDPSMLVFTTTLIVAFAPFAIVPSGQDTVPAACEHEPCDGVAETKVTPAGNGSLTDTL
jgi:hypothetical protein